MTEKEQKKAAKKFAEYWENKGDEKSDTQSFWLMLLREVLGVAEPEKYVNFEMRVKDETTNFIDCYIESTKVMIEQKKLGKDLRKAIKQSDGSMLTPFQQAKRYITNLPYDLHPRWLITCNFEEFLIYDMNKPNGEPEQILLKDLPKECYRLNFIVNTANENLKKEMELSLKAGEIVGVLYDEILKQYKNPDSPETLRSLNMLCVRLVFCLYAEDAGIFGSHEMFGQYLKQFQPKDVRKALIELFEVLDTKIEDRDPYMEDDLAAFPYVNGGLFADESIEIPRFNDKIVNLLIENASEGFDWSEISPTIFGAVFESTLNPETRRSGGMHYTSIENIHKVIDPLFLDNLKSELETIKAVKEKNKRKKQLNEYRKKLGSLRFLDPACGSGNFLTETYISLRKLENEALFEETGGQMMLGMEDIIHVSIGQFYGIEINDFAVTVAKTALWIAESQMMQETENLMQIDLDFLPLKSYANIVEGNALRTDWESVVLKDKLNYIMGNPPFVGARMMSNPQKADVMTIFEGVKSNGNLDYVSCWYKKSVELMMGTKIRSALVSTNSISQGEQVAILWKHLFEKGTHIDFAHRTFKWDSEASLKAHVHCVIIGFSLAENEKDKIIFDSDRFVKANNINGYLIDADNVFVENSSSPICNNAPIARSGNQPIDDGNYLFSEDEMREFVKIEPKSHKYFRRWIGSKEYINDIKRYCLWLGECTPKELRQMPECLRRVEKVKKFRLSSKRASTLKLAEKPTRFQVETLLDSDFLVMPLTSSERRRYVPIGFMPKDYLASNLVVVISNATIYHFGVLTSNVFMAWMRAVCGRLKSDYRITKDNVYNNFPWCSPTDKQKATIEKTAQAILDARAKYSDNSLADLYDELTMPEELRHAHRRNDYAVMDAYGFDKKITESECVAELMKMYKEMTK